MSSEAIRIRPARPSDAESLRAVYAPYVERTAVTFEYAVPDTEEFARRVAAVTKTYPWLAAEELDRSPLTPMPDLSRRAPLTAGPRKFPSTPHGIGAARDSAADCTPLLKRRSAPRAYRI